MIDMLVQEQGSGGDGIIRNNDIVMVFGFENQPYLAQFGGNEWWGNDLFFANEPNSKFLSLTEQVLATTPLNSAGRILIEQAMADDLAYLTDYDPETKISVSVTIDSVNRISAINTINGQQIAMNWSPDASFLNYQII